MASNPPPLSILVAIRAAHHAETTPQYDRVVFEFNSTIPLLQIQYVSHLIGDPSGLPVPIAGNAILQLQFTPAQAHNDLGQPTVPGDITYNLPNVKEVKGAGDFEGIVMYGIGLDHKAETRILTLANPSRVVIDFLQP